MSTGASYHSQASTPHKEAGRAKMYRYIGPESEAPQEAQYVFCTPYQAVSVPGALPTEVDRGFHKHQQWGIPCLSKE